MNVSFIHRGGPQMASYRYRAQIPARELNARINEYPEKIMVFAKPLPGDFELAKLCKLQKSKIVADFCDDHFSTSLYQAMLDIADLVTCSTPILAQRAPVDAMVIPDTYEFQEFAPHCKGNNLLWFGHAVNAHSLRTMTHGYPLRIVSNIEGAIPWSLETLRDELLRADVVLMPATADYKSPNRTLEAIRMGCFVVAEPHPAINDFPIWIGDIKEGIEWAAQHPQKANSMVAVAQDFIRKKYSPAIQVDAWKAALRALN